MSAVYGKPSYKPQVDDDNEVVYGKPVQNPRKGVDEELGVVGNCDIDLDGPEMPPEVEQMIRAGFIRKVYGILTAQMAFTVFFCVSCMFVSPLRHAIIGFYRTPGAGMMMFIPMVCILCALMKNKDQHPLNYQLLAAFTVCMSVPIGFICAAYYTAGLGHLILQAFILTCVCFGSLTAYTFYSGKDFSWMGAGLSSGLMLLMFWGFLGAVFGFGGGLLYSAFGAILFCGYIVFDTWRIMKEYGCDDAIIASIDLYLDIVNLFLYLLQILSSQSSDS